MPQNVPKQLSYTLVLLSPSWSRLEEFSTHAMNIDIVKSTLQASTPTWYQINSTCWRFIHSMWCHWDHGRFSKDDRPVDLTRWPKPDKDYNSVTSTISCLLTAFRAKLQAVIIFRKKYVQYLTLNTQLKGNIWQNWQNMGVTVCNRKNMNWKTVKRTLV